MKCRELLRESLPFSRLPDAVLAHICETSRRESFEKGAYIFREKEKFKGVLMVVARGLVELNIERDKEIILGYRGEGDLLGEDAFVSGSPYRYNALCVEETDVLVLPAELLQQVGQKHPHFYSQIASLLSKRLEAFYRESQELSEAKYVPSFFKKRIGEVVRYRKPVFADENSPVKEVARLMERHKSSAVLVRGKNGLSGIITEHDIVAKHVAQGMGRTAGEIMSTSIVKKGPYDLCYEAAMEMIKNRIKHIVVEDNERIVGILNIMDLIEHETTTYINVLTEISEAESVEEIAYHEKQLTGLVETFLENNMEATEICNIITHINDEATRRAIELSIREVGEPPCNFCFLVLGSHGRKEQTIRTDQDNALIYTDEGAAPYFEALSEKITDALEKIGFSRCPAGVMASNREWRGSRGEWEKKLHTLFVNPIPEKILKFSIIFDNRIIYGDKTLESEFYEIFKEGTKEHPGFIARLGKIASDKKPPIGLFGNFIVEKSGEHKNELDIKLRATLPIVESVRVLALIHNIRKANTFERVEELKNKGAIPETLAEEVRFAYDFILKLRLKNHLELIKAGKSPHNYINPKRLSSIERKILKECFATIYKLQRETFSQAGSMYVV